MNFYGSATSGDDGDNFSLIHPDSHFSNAIVVPDADLLIHGSYHRSGLDLVLTGHDGQHHVIAGYFASEHPPALAAPNGAYFSSDLVGLLAGSPAPHEYAQAQGQAAAPADSIGKVQKIAGDVTVQRNGVSVALNVGDVVYKSDVIVTGADSKCGLTFPDGTALELLPNTRMALNEYDYDAKSTSNQALFTLVEGTFGFVAGKVAHTGDMKIGTPVATMGIRGTTGVVQMVKSTTGEITYSYSVYDDPGTNHSGSWDMFVDNPDGTQTLVATVSQTGYVTFVTAHGLHEPRFVSTVPLSASQVDADQLIIIDLADLSALAGPRSIGNPGSGDNPLLELPPNLFPGLFGNGGTTTYNYQLPPLPGPTQPQNPQNPINPVASNVFIWSSLNNQNFPLGAFWNQGDFPNSANDIVIILTGVSQYPESLNLTFYSLTIDGPAQNGGNPQGELQMLGGELIVTNGLTVAGELLLGGDPPHFISYGTATILSGGQVIANGKGSTVEFVPDPSNPSATSVIVENLGTIAAQNGGIVKFIDSLVTNEPAPTGDSESTPQPGIIEATGKDALVKFKDSILFNAGLVAAEHGGTVKFVDGSLVNNDPGSINTDTNAETESGEIESIGRDSLVLFRHSSLDNFGLVAAEYGGRVEFLHAGTVTNAAETTPLSGGDVESPAGEIKSTGRGSDVNFVHTNLDNFGLVVADGYGAITFCDAKIVNESSLLTGATLAPAGLIEAEYGGFIGVDGGKVINDAGASIDAKYGGVIDIGWAEVKNHKGALIEASDHGEISLFDADLDNEGTIKSEDCSCISIVGSDDGSVINIGLIEAKSFGEVKFDGLASVVNDDTGEIEAKDHGTILFEDVAVTNYDESTDSGAGLIAADGCGSTVELANASIDGGTVQSRDGGKIEAIYGANEFLDVTINGGIVQVDGHVSLALEGDTIIDKTVAFEGPGVFKLDGDDSITGGDAHALLKNDSTIEGSGQIVGTADNPLTLDNEAGGKVDANVDGQTLMIDTAGNTIANAGLLEATRGGILAIDSDVDNRDGTIKAHGAGSVVQLSAVTVTGGTLVTGDPYWFDDGLIEVMATSGMTVFDGSQTHDPVTIEGFVQVDPDAELALLGTIDNEGGTINVGPPDYYGTDGSQLVIDGDVTLDGFGAVVLEGSHDGIVAGSDGGTLANNSSIIGARGGFIGTGDNELTFDNSGTVNSEAGDAGPLVINTGSNTVINTGTLEATAGSELDLYGTYQNKDGTIGAFSEGVRAAVVKLFNATIDGGTLQSDTDLHDGSMIEVVTTGGANESVFDGSQHNNPLTVDAYVQVDAGANLELVGTIHDLGIIDVDSAASGADLIIDGTVDLDDGGQVVLAGAGDSIIGAVGGEASNTLVNSDTISGYGKIGNFGNDGSTDLTLNNADKGVVDADVSGQTLAIDTDQTIINTGLMEATGGGTLEIASDVNNVDGMIKATGTRSTVQFDAVTVTSGKIIIDAGDTLAIENGTTHLDADVENHGDLVIDSGSIIATLDVDAGSTIHGGTITIDGAGDLDVLGGTFDSVTIDDKGIFDINGPLTIAGDIAVDLDGGTFADTGVLTVAANTSATLSGVSVGTVDVENNATFTIDHADAAEIDFKGSGAELVLDQPSDFTGTIDGLAAGDIIHLVGTAVTSAVLDGSTLLLNGTAASFTISGGLPAGDTLAFKSDGAGGTDLEVAPQVLSVATSPVSGTEGRAIPLNISDTVAAGSQLTSIVISDIPTGATLSDSNHDTLQVINGSITLTPSELAGLAITTANDTNFTLSSLATATDGHGYEYTVPATETVTVDPLAPTVDPVAVSGIEGTPIALNLGISPNALAGDGGSNSLYSVKISDIPSGATLTDSNHDTLQVINGSITLDAAQIAAGDLNGLAITADDPSFTLNISAVEQDKEGNLSAATTATESVNGAPALQFVPDAATLSTLEGEGYVLTGGVQIGTFIGANSGDKYIFTITGPDHDFSSSSTGTNSEALFTNKSLGSFTDFSGTATVYSLTVDVDDTTLHEDSGPLPFDVVVDGSLGLFQLSDTIKLTGANSLDINTATPTIVYGLGGNDTIDATGMTANVWFVGGAGSDTMTGGSGVNTYVFASVSESETPREYGFHGGATDTITNFNAASDVIDLAPLNTVTTIQGLLHNTSTDINPDSVAWVVSGSEVIVYANTDPFSSHRQDSSSGYESEIILNASSNAAATTLAESLSAKNFILAPPSVHNADFGNSNGDVDPAGTAGRPINLALSNPRQANGGPVAVTITGMPSDWQLNEGTSLGNGAWTLQSNDLSMLAITTAAAFAGAMVLNVTETWTNADGTTGTAVIADNVEAYAAGSPIFAVAGDDNLNGSGGNDTFVFAQPIGNDTIYNFNSASDTIDLAGFASVGGYGDLHITDDAGGDAVITLGNGETITLHGVDASALAASDFVFNETPATENHADMTVGNGAVLPLSGTIDNTGAIAVDSTGSETVLQVAGDGITLEGGGQVTLSGDAAIVGTNPSDVLINVDNTISGSGQIGTGDGNLTLVNEAHGTINADVSGAALIIDTGHAITNAGVLEASNGGLLQVDDAVSGGSADIAGGVMAFEAQSNVNVTFDNGQSGTAYGMLQLDGPASFTGSIAGFTGTDAAHSDVVDLSGVDFNSTQFAETYDSTTGLLAVTDGTNHANLTFDNFQGALDFASDGNGGTAITAAPAEANPLTAQGTLSFTDSDAADNPSASVTPEGQNYLGNITLGAVSEGNGTASVEYGFSLSDDQINLASGQTLTQSYEVSLTDAQNSAANAVQTVAVTIGGAGNDNFVFTPGVGADTVLNFNPQQDTIELDHFTNVQTVQELQSLITTDAHGDAVINLGNHDSVTLADTTSAQLQQAIQAGHVILH